MVTKIRLHGGPGDGLNLAIDTAPGGAPPSALLYDPDTITVYDASAGGPWPAGAAYYECLEHAPDESWGYRFLDRDPSGE